MGSSAQCLWVTAGVDTWPRSQLWTTAYVCTACKLRMDFTFLNGWQNSSQEEYFMACENHMKFECQRPQIKCSRKTAMSVRVYSLWMVLHCKSRVESLQQKPSGLQSLNISWVALYKMSADFWFTELLDLFHRQK